MGFLALANGEREALGHGIGGGDGEIQEGGEHDDGADPHRAGRGETGAEGAARGGDETGDGGPTSEMQQCVGEPGERGEIERQREPEESEYPERNAHGGDGGGADEQAGGEEPREAGGLSEGEREQAVVAVAREEIVGEQEERERGEGADDEGEVERPEGLHRGVADGGGVELALESEQAHPDGGGHEIAQAERKFREGGSCVVRGEKRVVGDLARVGAG